MAIEKAWLARNPGKSAQMVGYERRDSSASLWMGRLSVIAPFVLPPLLRPLTPGRGRWGKALLAATAGAALATTVADRTMRARRSHQESPDSFTPLPSHRAEEQLRSVRVAAATQRIAGPAAIICGGLAAATALADATRSDRMFSRRVLPDLGNGPLAWTAALVGWDFLYYWSHRLQHEHRYLWSIHVVHHSSERYNLTTALRQPVAESFGTMMPYGILGLLGVRPDLIFKARGINLIWQFWIHTETVRSLGLGESVLSTPSAHRVHHGSNKRYLDRNHGGILIIWDRIFGTYEREVERTVYGLTTNIESFNLWTIATHEYRALFADVARSVSWRQRIAHVVGPPGWKPALADGTRPG